MNDVSDLMTERAARRRDPWAFDTDADALAKVDALLTDLLRDCDGVLLVDGTLTSLRARQARAIVGACLNLYAESPRDAR